MKKLLYFIPFIFLACKPQKSVTEYKYIEKIDTLVKIQTNTIYQGIDDTTIITSPCDSVGILRDFYAKISIPFGKVIAEGKGNKIKLSVSTQQLATTLDSTYHSKGVSNTVIKEKETIKYRIPEWAIWVIIIETLIIIIYIDYKFF